MIIKTILGKQDTMKIAQAQKLEVRELEEHDGKGNFVAYVDEGQESYDVNILLEGQNVLTHTCDCRIKDTYCVHQLAVLLALDPASKQKSGTSPAKKVPAKKKKKESEELLLDTAREDLNNWLLDLFKNNKDIELNFLLRFSKSKTEYLPQDIAKMFHEGVVAVIGKRKKIQAAEVKKIIDIWDKSLIPVWESIQLHITKQETLMLYTALINQAYGFTYKYQYEGTRIQTFVRNCYDRLGLYFSLIPSDLQWFSHFEWIWTEMWREGSKVVGMLNPVKVMYSYLSEERKSMFANKVLLFLEELLEEEARFPVEVDDFFLDIMIDSGRFNEIFFYFEPRAWENKYNLKLIHAVKDIEPDNAIHFCVAMIQQNVNPEYNLPYLDILEELFLKLDNLEGLAGVKMDKFAFNPNLEDFEFIMEHIADAEVKKRFRSNLLTRFRNSLNDPIYADIYFGILAYDKDYKKMLDVIDYGIGVYPLLKYWDYMYGFDKMKFAKCIATNFHIPYYSDLKEESRLADKLIEHFDKETLRQLFKPDSRSSYLRTFRGLLYEKLV